MNRNNLIEVLTSVARQYPEELAPGELKEVRRIAFNIGLALTAMKHKSHRDLEICDLGGGVGLFSVGCAAYGMKRTVLIDDFDDAVNHRVGNGVFDLHQRLGVEVLSRDVVAEGIHDLPGTFDVITSFDSMEHWHHSPKTLFREVMSKLKPGGVFVLGVPNCINMRKRITIPFGRGKWSSIEEWYDVPRFRGHVREPDVSDLLYIARDMGLVDIKVVGRNWAGHASPRRWIRVAARLSDHLLRLAPSLCADIYVVGRKA